MTWYACTVFAFFSVIILSDAHFRRRRPTPLSLLAALGIAAIWPLSFAILLLIAGIAAIVRHRELERLRILRRRP